VFDAHLTGREFIGQRYRQGQGRTFTFYCSSGNPVAGCERDGMVTSQSPPHVAKQFPQQTQCLQDLLRSSEHVLYSLILKKL
jgi:hypothetical protein